MPRRRWVIAAGVLVAGLTAVVLGAPLLTAAPSGADPGTRQVSYRGLVLPVPKSWPVTDLAAHPTECARLDHHAVYLGAPGAAAQCPPRVAGRTGTVSVQPMPESLPESATVLPAGRPFPKSVPSTVDHSVTMAVPAAGVLITATYQSDVSEVAPILAGARLTNEAKPKAAPRHHEAAAPNIASPGTFAGYGFDACQAPTNTVMDGWLNSRYRGIGVYIGGGDLGCPNQPNLNADWVARQSYRGWHVFPIYVGRQAPCSDQPFKITDPVNQGIQDAGDAATRAKALGMGPGSVIFQDMEYYPRGGNCSVTTLRYLSSWTQRIHEQGYRSGVYSSRSAAIDDLSSVYGNGSYIVPDIIDFAAWDNVATVNDDNIPGGYWAPHARLKQYSGGHDETYAGVTINIDGDYMDVGSGSQEASGGDGALYRVGNDTGYLRWYKENQPERGGTTFAAGSGEVINQGWGKFTRVFGGGKGVLYAITQNGTLTWFQHTGVQDGSAGFAAGSGTAINQGWAGFTSVFSGGDGVIYAVSPDGSLHWYRYLPGSGFAAGSGQVIDHGWNMFARAFADHGNLYGITPNGELYWYGQANPTGCGGTFAVNSGSVINHGWNSFTAVFPGGNGIIYAVRPDGSLVWYRHLDPENGAGTFANGSSAVIDHGWT